MKRFYFILLAFALLVAGCTKQGDEMGDNGGDVTVDTPSSITSITAKIANVSRTTGSLSSTSFQAYWSKDDKIMVTDLLKSAPYTLTEGDGSTTGKFAGEFSSKQTTLYAIYPASSASVLSGYISISIPTTQSHSPSRNTALKDKLVLFGRAANSTSFNMLPASAIINFQITLKDVREIKSIKMISTKGYLTGKGRLTASSGSIGSLTERSVTLNYTSPSKGTSADGWVTTAPIDLKASGESIRYEITTDNGKYTFIHTPQVTMKAGEIYTISLNINNFTQALEESALQEGRFYYDGTPDNDTSNDPEGTIRGTISYNDGTAAAGIAVSDGFQVVKTDRDGSFKFVPHKDTWYIFYSIPADVEVSVNSNGQPVFWSVYNNKQTVYDFKLNKLAGGAEQTFTLLCLADPQCSSAANRTRFNGESVPFLKSFSQTKEWNCYGVTLGDIVSSSSSNNTMAQMPYMRSHMAKDNIGFPVFQTMGNHDNVFFSSTSPIAADEKSSTYQIKAQRAFEETFGPINYSWNRGGAHIINMRDIIYNSTIDSSDYVTGFSDEQYAWLEADLALVPKDKMVILCVHIPIINSSNANVQKALRLMAQYKEAHIMSGHTHYMRNEPTLSNGIFEHVHAAVCGAWWYSNVNGDGSPNGFGVYDIEGNTIKNWHYMGVNKGMNDRNYQIRLYRGNHKSGGQYEYFAQQHGDGVLLANIFNADPNWSIKVYEDGEFSGYMTKIPYKKETETSLAKGTSKDNPTKPSTASSQDWWAIGHLVGVKNRSRKSYFTSGFHLYKYTLKNKNAAIRVEAVDRFGTVYSETSITADYDYSLLVW